MRGAGYSLTRRRFVRGAGLVGLGLLAGCGIGMLRAQPPARVARIAFVWPDSRSSVDDRFLQAFGDALGELGYVQGQNVSFEVRHLDGMLERAPAVVAELISLPVDVIVTPGAPVTQLVKDATSTVPIIFTQSNDPVAAGLVQSLSRPGGNVTGISNMAVQLSAKRLQLLKETIPSASLVGVFWSRREPGSGQAWEAMVGAAPALGVRLLSLGLESAAEFDRVAELADAERPDAIVVAPGGLVNGALG
jgi:putative ABC transport system substrate-binding protein